MSNLPLVPSLGFSSARILERMDANQDRKLSVEELKNGVGAKQGEPITDAQLSATGIDAKDQATIKAALATHESDPTSVLVNFSPTSAELTATVVFPTVPNDDSPETPVAENITPLETFPHPDLAPGNVLRGPALAERVGEMQGQITKGLGRLEKLPQTPEVVAATKQLTSLQTLLGKGGTEQVKSIQDHLLEFDKNLAEGEASIEQRLTYTARNGEERNNDNLYGGLTDTALNDYITRLSNESSGEGELSQIPAEETGTVQEPEANTGTAQDPDTEVVELPEVTEDAGSEVVDDADPEVVEVVDDADLDVAEVAEGEPVQNPVLERSAPNTPVEYTSRLEAASETIESLAPGLNRLIDQHADFLQAGFRISANQAAVGASPPKAPPYSKQEEQAAFKLLTDVGEDRGKVIQERFRELNQKTNSHLANHPQFETLQKAIAEKLMLLTEGAPVANETRELAFFQPASFDSFSFDSYYLGGRQDPFSQGIAYA